MRPGTCSCGSDGPRSPCARRPDRRPRAGSTGLRPPGVEGRIDVDHVERAVGQQRQDRQVLALDQQVVVERDGAVGMSRRTRTARECATVPGRCATPSRRLVAGAGRRRGGGHHRGAGSQRRAAGGRASLAPGRGTTDTTRDPFAYDADRRAEFEARAAAGLSHVLYAKSPGGAAGDRAAGAAAGARRSRTSRRAPIRIRTRSRPSSSWRAPAGRTSRPSMTSTAPSA